MKFYMVTVVTRYAVKAINEVNAISRVKDNEGREVDVMYGTDVSEIDPGMLHIYAGEEVPS